MKDGMCKLHDQDENRSDWFLMKYVHEDEPHAVVSYIKANKPFFDRRYRRISKQVEAVYDVL